MWGKTYIRKKTNFSPKKWRKKLCGHKSAQLRPHRWIHECADYRLWLLCPAPNRFLHSCSFRWSLFVVFRINISRLVTAGCKHLRRAPPETCSLLCHCSAAVFRKARSPVAGGALLLTDFDSQLQEFPLSQHIQFHISTFSSLDVSRWAGEWWNKQKRPVWFVIWLWAHYRLFLRSSRAALPARSTSLLRRVTCCN